MRPPYFSLLSGGEQRVMNGEIAVPSDRDDVNDVFGTGF
jgi:hypothetical protein